VHQDRRELTSVIAYSSTFAPDPSNPFSVSPQDLAKDIAVNTTSAYVAASCFASLPPPPPPSPTPVFIFTGNMTFSILVPELASLGTGKNGTYYFMELAAATYGASNHSFWYVADERTATGQSVMTEIHGEAHAQFYKELVAEKEQRPWMQTFVRRRGYVDFEGGRDRGCRTVGELVSGLGEERARAGGEVG
jgi:hypothetical protein